MSRCRVIFRTCLREHRDVRIDHADHRHPAAIDQLLRNLRSDMHVSARPSAKRVDPPELETGDAGETSGSVKSGDISNPGQRLVDDFQHEIRVSSVDAHRRLDAESVTE